MSKFVSIYKNVPQVVDINLGPQISWRTVFIVEYAGPILIHIAALLARPYLYTYISHGGQLSNTQFLSMILILQHYLKRELEIAFVHKFSATTMPFFIQHLQEFFSLLGFRWCKPCILDLLTYCHYRRTSNPNWKPSHQTRRSTLPIR
ncbi:hypothetical protein EAF04_006591 [Stromatinia cepivora]|nr:hypothetical protein EAF04_006591 [Stromatinia cepivora]